MIAAHLESRSTRLKTLSATTASMAQNCCDMPTASLYGEIEMTMPHLENCHHSESGWCLECVKSLHEECERRTNERDRAYFVTYAAGEFSAGRISKSVLLGIVKTWERDQGAIFNGWRERAIAMQQALKGARTNARKDGVTTRLFAEWCGISSTLLSEWTGDELPRSPPDFIEKARG